MNTQNTILRRGLAWLLLLLITSQHLAGRVYVSVVYAVEIESCMTETEQRLAGIVQEKVGVETRVQLVEADRLRDIENSGYAVPFVFSEEIDGATYRFTIDNDTVKPVAHFSESNKTSEQLPTDRAPILKLFSSLYLDVSNLSKSILFPVFSTTAFDLSNPDLSFDPAVPSPPPWQV